jgi:hypothetical protein
MPANRFNGFADYGVGIGLRVPHYHHILSRRPVVDWFEIISENYMVDGGKPLRILDQILDQYQVVQHGVSMYFGSAPPLNREHLKRIKELTRRTKTPWLSDHLCWGSVDGPTPTTSFHCPIPLRPCMLPATPSPNAEQQSKRRFPPCAAPQRILRCIASTTPSITAGLTAKLISSSPRYKKSRRWLWTATLMGSLPASTASIRATSLCSIRWTIPEMYMRSIPIFLAISATL